MTAPTNQETPKMTDRTLPFAYTGTYEAGLVETVSAHTTREENA
jgi:hypothetical protein